ncbi:MULTISPECIES: helix-turn-helix transcriptional regulator [unclassified Solibacillus]|uniref:helix-turn-helix transcriptional regulator n=1 Tax=unclassified Solibacillus TaxID=2637870 RepID=UPI0030F77058
MINMNLKMLRLQHKLTQEQVALELNVSRQVIAKWEKGDSVPDLNFSMALAKFYNVTLDNLVNYKDDTTSIALPPKGKHFFGITKVSERGQIVIPKKAREIFQIKSGDSLVILGDEERGLAIVPKEMLQQFMNMVNDPFDQEE